MKNRFQRGYVLWLILVLMVVLVGGSWKYSQMRQQERRDKEQAAAKAQDERLQAERKEVEARAAQEKQRQRDALSASLKAVDDVLVRWDDAVKVAGTTSRIALSQPVAALQGLRRDAEQLTVPPCLDEGKVQLVQAMDKAVEGFLVFMRNELKLGDTLARVEFDTSATHMAAFKAARAACPK